MKKFLVLLFVSSVSFHSFSQQASKIRPAALGISFGLVDYTTAERIRNSSLASVLNKEQTASFKDMSPAISMTYFKGLKSHIDFAGTLLGSFTNVNLEGSTNASDAFLLEGDASVNLKMFSEDFFFSPYLSAGIGFSSYNKKLGAFVPLGAGLKFNIFNEAAVFITSQYRVPVTTETANYHFVHGFGIAGVIGKRGGSTAPTIQAP